jgi:hypothetical protein
MPGRFTCCLTKHRRQPAQLLDQLADLCGRHGAGSLGSLKKGLQFVALSGAATQCSHEVLNGHTGFHCRNQSSNLAIRLAELALQRGVASSRYGVHLLPARQVFRIGQSGDPFVESRCHRVLTEVDRTRVINQIRRHRTRSTQLAPVKDAGCSLPDTSGALHTPSTHGTEQKPAKRIWCGRLSAADKTRTTPRLCTKTNRLSQLIGD